MANLITWCEIPVSDFDRAAKFYKAVLEKDVQETPMGETRYGILPSDQNGVGAALIQDKSRTPGPQGALVYLAVDEINAALARIEAAGGKTLAPKMSLGEMSPGYAAEFQDSEGN